MRKNELDRTKTYTNPNFCSKMFYARDRPRSIAPCLTAPARAWLKVETRNNLSGHRPDKYNERLQSPEGQFMSTLNRSKTERIDVRASTPVKQLLQEAARACHKNVSEFLLDAGVTAAAQTLADRRQFVLDEAQWQAFQEALDRPVQSKPRLSRLLREPGVLD
jgi:uncharacterized protein (DUF1778 family)